MNIIRILSPVVLFIAIALTIALIEDMIENIIYYNKMANDEFLVEHVTGKVTILSVTLGTAVAVSWAILYALTLVTIQ